MMSTHTVNTFPVPVAWWGSGYQVGRHTYRHRKYAVAAVAALKRRGHKFVDVSFYDAGMDQFIGLADYID